MDERRKEERQEMKNLIKEILKIITSILLMTCGLILMLRFLDGRLIIGACLMVVGIIMWMFMVIGVIKNGS